MSGWSCRMIFPLLSGHSLDGTLALRFAGEHAEPSPSGTQQELQHV